MVKLQSDILMEAQRVFSINGWTTEEIEDCDVVQMHSMLFERFCAWLSFYTRDEQLLLLDLTKRFLHIPVIQYEKEILQTFRQITTEKQSLLQSANRLFFFALKQRKDRGKSKSADFMMYHLRSTMNYSRMPILESKDVRFCDDSCHLDFHPLYDRIILLDDFIGSGRQATTALKEFCEDHLVPPSSITILSLVAHQKGCDCLRDAGVDLYVGRVVNRGISDYYTGDSLVNNIKAMTNIEQKLKLDTKSEYRFGYAACEALVSMARTPNNTFPVYWMKCKNNSVCPFPR